MRTSLTSWLTRQPPVSPPASPAQALPVIQSPLALPPPTRLNSGINTPPTQPTTADGFLSNTPAVPALANTPPAPQPDLRSANAFNLTQAAKTLFKAPGDFLFGLSRYYNNLASGHFKDSPYFNQDSWYGRWLMNTTVPEHLHQPDTAEAKNELHQHSTEINLLNVALKIPVYLLLIFKGNRATLKLNAEETDPVHKRLTALKTYADIGENSGQLIDKILYIPIFMLVGDQHYAAAAIARTAGLGVSTLAWVASFFSGLFMLGDEWRMRAKKIEGESAEGQPSTHKGITYGINMSNVQTSVWRITGACVRIPTQTLALASGALLYLRANNPETYGGLESFFAEHAPGVNSYMNTAANGLSAIDSQSMYAWVNGAYNVPDPLKAAFIACGIIGPALSSAANAAGFFQGARTYLAARIKPEFSALKTYAVDAMKTTSIGIVSNAFYLGSAILVATPESEAHGLMLAVAGSLLLSWQYLRGEQEHLKALGKNLVAKAAAKWRGWTGISS